jgi:predicted nuclease of predicted toxin-antitoxin system
VKFLVDQQLPPALAEHIRKLGFDCQHVAEVGLASASDNDVGRYTRTQERIIISEDEDSLYLARNPEAGMRFLWVRLGNCRTQFLLAAFERLWPMIESCLKAGDQVVEIR